MTVGSLCSGIGGLDLGVEAAGWGPTLWQAEYDAAPSKVLAAHWPGIPNYGDITTTDWADVEPVDLIIAGYPCQPFSLAGRRQGAEDARHLWPFVAVAVRVLRPRYVLLENVAGHLSLGFDVVQADLAEIGYDTEWTCIRASEIGAPHRRERLFVAARNADRASENALAAESSPRSAASESSRALADAAGARRSGNRSGDPKGKRPSSNARRRGPATADADDFGGDRTGRARNRSGEPANGCFEAWGPYAGAIARWERIFGWPAPTPVDGDGRLEPAFTEWMMGFEPGWATELLNRTAALKALGNGVVPQVGEVAARLLLPEPVAC